ncbi:inositol monophosphatase [Paenibacillus sp. FJAT-26967]|uniref:inositol monophosphatase family protein n=1 Tax=Paenibacillus sp. FJAT-26967 TaxID=1729690 RepID=UPI000838367B|nr:inositol monophosphatase [Paenibacillus sp. FJAT-26967]
MEEILRAAKKLAIQTALQAGQEAKNRFENLNSILVKDDFGDMVTEVDHLAEEIIVNGISRHFPDHVIDSEEAGHNGKTSDWVWVVDPLDGTNNYAIGMPLYSTTLALLYRGKPVLGVVYEPMVDRLFVTMAEKGAYCNNVRIQVKKNEKIQRSSIGWIQGHAVQNEAKAVQLRHYLDVNVRRMMRLWAPTIQWCMLAKGDLDGIVLYNSESSDLYAGILLVQEAGGIVIDYEGNPFEGGSAEHYLIACHPEHKEYFMELVRQGLGKKE